MPEEERADEVASDWGCYRHPYEEAGVKCTRCDRPICPKCMITAPVGFQCPECVKGAPPVRRYREIRSGGSAQDIPITVALIAVNVAVFFPSLNNRGILVDYGLNGFAVSALGDWYRLVTSGFLHFSLIHIGFNMLILFQLGQLLEPSIGKARYLALYFAALLGGSVGALLVSPDSLTAGASGAVYGLMGAAAMQMRSRGINPLQTSIGSLIVINLVLSFILPNVSIGGHIGGLVAGALAGFVIQQTDDQPALGAAIVGALAVALFGAGLVIA